MDNETEYRAADGKFAPRDTIAAGDVCWLNGGGPELTAFAVSGATVVVAWFVDGDLKRTEVPTVALHKR